MKKEAPRRSRVRRGLPGGELAPRASGRAREPAGPPARPAEEADLAVIVAHRPEAPTQPTSPEAPSSSSHARLVVGHPGGGEPRVRPQRQGRATRLRAGQWSRVARPAPTVAPRYRASAGGSARRPSPGTGSTSLRRRASEAPAELAEGVGVAPLALLAARAKVAVDDPCRPLRAPSGLSTTSDSGSWPSGRRRHGRRNGEWVRA